MHFTNLVPYGTCFDTSFLNILVPTYTGGFLSITRLHDLTRFFDCKVLITINANKENNIFLLS